MSTHHVLEVGPHAVLSYDWLSQLDLSAVGGVGIK